jgi:hypothetical protein
MPRSEIARLREHTLRHGAVTHYGASSLKLRGSQQLGPTVLAKAGQGAREAGVALADGQQTNGAAELKCFLKHAVSCDS